MKKTILYRYHYNKFSENLQFFLPDAFVNCIVYIHSVYIYRVGQNIGISFQGL